MKINGTREVIARIAGPGLVLGAVLALMLSGSGVVRAQASATSPAVPAAARAKAAPAAQAVHPAAPAKRQPGGTHEGIKVHGHWMIEVRNPDGRLVSHTEFENSLVQTGGESNLVDILIGLDVPGGYMIAMGANSGAPCAALSGSGSGNCILLGSLVSPEPAAFGDQSTECGGTGFKNQITATGPCFPLSIGASGSTDTGATGLVFTGTAVANAPAATFPASITDVYLYPLTCPVASLVIGTPPGGAATSPNACATAGQAAGFFALTHAPLPTANTPTTPCGGTGQVSCAVTVPAAGDSINVQVTISFQ